MSSLLNVSNFFILHFNNVRTIRQSVINVKKINFILYLLLNTKLLYIISIFLVLVRYYFFKIALRLHDVDVSTNSQPKKMLDLVLTSCTTRRIFLYLPLILVVGKLYWRLRECLVPKKCNYTVLNINVKIDQNFLNNLRGLSQNRLLNNR